LKAYDQLKAQGISIRVVDAYCLQPIDAATLKAGAKATNGRVITVEDHYSAGGLGDAVAEALSESGVVVERLAVRTIPRSGEPEELVDKFGISARHIVEAVKKK
jgi:transketolase